MCMTSELQQIPFNIWTNWQEMVKSRGTMFSTQVHSVRYCNMFCDMLENNFPSSCSCTPFFLNNNHNMKEFPLNLGTIQKLLLAGWRLFYFHLKSHIISCNCMSYHHDHVTYTAAPLFVCGDTPSIHCTLAGHQKVCSHGKHISVLLFWHRQNQAIEHA